MDPSASSSLLQPEGLPLDKDPTGISSNVQVKEEDHWQDMSGEEDDPSPPMTPGTPGGDRASQGSRLDTASSTTSRSRSRKGRESPLGGSVSGSVVSPSRVRRNIAASTPTRRRAAGQTRSGIGRLATATRLDEVPRAIPAPNMPALPAMPALPLPRPPSLNDTLGLLLSPLGLLLRPLGLVLPGLLYHIINGILLSFAAIALFFLLLALGKHALESTFRGLANSVGLSWLLPSNRQYLTSDVALPVRALATSSCAMFNILCPLSALSTRNGNSTQLAQAWWRFNRPEAESEEYRLDVGKVAKALTEEVMGARDIFTSVRLLGEGGLVRGLEYVKVWELGVAVQVSTMEEKDILGRQLIELGDLTRDLTDEVVSIDAMSVNAFSWLQWEFSRLVQMLSMPPAVRPSSAKLERHLHSLIVRLSRNLDQLHGLTANAVNRATMTSSHGQHLRQRLAEAKSDLEYQESLQPGWKKIYDLSKHAVVGGEPSKAQLISRDLALTRKTIQNVAGLREQLEVTRTQVRNFRDQVDQFSASIVGFHLGASEEGGLGPEEELRVLASVVEELGEAVSRAKGKPILMIDE